MQTRKPSDLPLPQLHQHLLHAVAPRPIAFVSTVNKEGEINLAPFSFFNCFGSNPPILVFSPALSGRTGASKNTHDNVKEVAECVVNIGHYEMLHQMNLAAGMYPKGVNEFAKSGLTPMPSVMVKPPRVEECYVQFECIVKQIIETGHGGGAGNLIICEVILIHTSEKVLKEDGTIDPFKMDYVARMGKQYWCKVPPENIFEVPTFKPANELGIGFDQLPEGIRHSKYLSGNDIAQIAYSNRLPEEKELFEMGPVPEIKIIIDKYGNDFESFERQMHLLAKQEIEQHNDWFAFKILMIVEHTRESLPVK
jgi:flavin reductase (DIM6/NTAB) family NADH-FMN oxidoreductase RutF